MGLSSAGDLFFFQFSKHFINVRAIGDLEGILGYRRHLVILLLALILLFIPSWRIVNGGVLSG